MGGIRTSLFFDTCNDHLIPKYTLFILHKKKDKRNFTDMNILKLILSKTTWHIIVWWKKTNESKVHYNYKSLTQYPIFYWNGFVFTAKISVSRYWYMYINVWNSNKSVEVSILFINSKRQKWKKNCFRYQNYKTI